MLYKPDAILRELASFTTLEDGDIVMTGTPAGVGAIGSGQAFMGQVLLAGKPLISVAWTAR
jgi:2-keto-4-pentenoate hydratase/2-oxohepta-3-ene-1,7-dioic acid hydratase in catechol pathway